MFIGMVHKGSPSRRTPLEESSNENGATSGARGSLGSPVPRGRNVVTMTDPTIAALVPESTPALQTIQMVTMQMAKPQPGMEPLRDLFMPSIQQGEDTPALVPGLPPTKVGQSPYQAPRQGKMAQGQHREIGPRPRSSILHPT
jgi:hypothetical protein